MKKLLLMFIVLLSVLTVNASEKVIDEKELPVKVQEFIKEHYPEDKISIATEENDFFDKDYKVILTNGVKLEFDGKGNWTQIECKGNCMIPTGVVPEKIKEYINSKYPSNSIVKIEKDNNDIEVEMNNDIGLTFNNIGELIEID